MREQWNAFLETYIQPLASDPQFVFYALILCAVLLVAVMVNIALRRSCRAIRVFDNQAGQVNVSNKALYELINSACLQVNAVHKPRVRFKTSRTKLNILVKFKLAEGTVLADISGELQNQIKRTLQETLNIQKTILINPTVTGFVPAAKTNNSVIPAESIQDHPQQKETILPPAPPPKPKQEQPETANWSLYERPESSKIQPLDTHEEAADDWQNPAAIPTDEIVEKPADPAPKPAELDFELAEQVSDPADPTHQPEKKKRSFFGFGSKKAKQAEAEQEEVPIGLDELMNNPERDDGDNLSSTSPNDAQEEEKTKENPKSL